MSKVNLIMFLTNIKFRLLLLLIEFIFLINSILIFVINDINVISNVIEIVLITLSLIYIFLNIFLIERMRNLLITLSVVCICYIILLSCSLIYINDLRILTIFGIIRLIKNIFNFFIANDLYLNIKSMRIGNKVNNKSEEMHATLNIEKIIFILNELKDKCSKKDAENIEFCINAISNNKLFVPLILEEVPETKNEIYLKQEIAFWVQNFEKIERIINDQPSTDEILIRHETPRKIVEELRIYDTNGLNDKFLKFFELDQNKKIISCLSNIYNLDFNVFHLKEASNGEELLAMMYYLFYRNDYFTTFNIRTQKFINFAKRVQASYHNNYYHNATHGADVMQVNII
jgi:hypothetical protein